MLRLWTGGDDERPSRPLLCSRRMESGSPITAGLSRARAQDQSAWPSTSSPIRPRALSIASLRNHASSRRGARGRTRSVDTAGLIGDELSLASTLTSVSTNGSFSVGKERILPAKISGQVLQRSLDADRDGILIVVASQTNQVAGVSVHPQRLSDDHRSRREFLLRVAAEDAVSNVERRPAKRRLDVHIGALVDQVLHD